MKLLKYSLLLLLLLLETPFSESISIKGRVINSLQNPLSDCIVSLKNKDMKDTTDISGNFLIQKIPATVQNENSALSFLPNNSIVFSVQPNEKITLTLYNLNGQIIFKHNPPKLPSGIYQTSISNLIPPEIPIGLYIISFQVGTSEQSQKITVSSHHPAQEKNTFNLIDNPRFAKKLLTVDSLIFELKSYKRYALSLDTLTIDLKNITLEPIPQNIPPSQPLPVYPKNEQQNIPLSLTLKWECTDKNSDSLSYNVLLDTLSPPIKLIQKSLSNDTLTIQNLSSGKTYYWKVTASDKKDSTSSQICSFSTIPTSIPPSQPLPVYPTNGQQNIPLSLTLKWECTNKNSDSLSYTILLDTLSPPIKLIQKSLPNDTLNIQNLSIGKTYYWKIIASNKKDSTSSQICSFSTILNNWTTLIPTLRKQCYIIGIDYKGKIQGLGSGFAISANTIMTSAHVVNGLIDVIKKYGKDNKKLVAVRDEGKIEQDFSYEIDQYAIHPSYDSSAAFTYDFGIVTIKSGTTLTNFASIEETPNLYSIAVGDEIGTICFPNETNDLNSIQPIATFKNGTISALLPLNPNTTTSAKETNIIIQHNLNTTSGTSGSPIYNKNGKIIAIHNAGKVGLTLNNDTWSRIPASSAVDYSIRIDQKKPLETAKLDSFIAIQPQKVYYHFINGTYSNLQFYFNGTLLDTIYWSDSLTIWDYKSASGKDAIELFAIVATKNSLDWRDTLSAGFDFSQKYTVPNTYFLLGIIDSSNKTMKSCVVSSTNPSQYDSSAVFLAIGAYGCIGYYKSSALTSVRLYFNATVNWIYWDNIDTRSSTNEAKYVPFTPTVKLAKQSITSNQIIANHPNHHSIYFRQNLLR
jgi:V8-like Glu-specific endopeptidase